MSTSQIEAFVILIFVFVAFWFFFGFFTSKFGKRPYDEDTSIKDGFKSIGWFFFAIIIFSVLGFIWYLIKNL